MRCLLCGDQLEDHNHLLFDYRVSSQIWSWVQNQYEIQIPRLDWPYLIDWLAQKWTDNSFHTVIWKLCLATTVYNIWQERNFRYHTNRSNSVILIGERTIDLVRLKLSSMHGVRDIAGNRSIQMRWRLPNSIFV